VAIGDVMVGGPVSRVEASRLDNFKVSDSALGYTGWQDYALSDDKGLTKLEPEDPHPSRALGVLGMPVFTAYMGLLDIGRPVAGETVVVAAASGPVGSVVGQIAKITGCTGVGIAGGEKKCRCVMDEQGFVFCVDHHTEDLPGRLAAACPKGIDVYFENVGGAVFDAAGGKNPGPRGHRVRSGERTRGFYLPARRRELRQAGDSSGTRTDAVRLREGARARWLQPSEQGDGDS
jgi:hypothetical protein